MDRWCSLLSMKKLYYSGLIIILCLLITSYSPIYAYELNETNPMSFENKTVLTNSTVIEENHYKDDKSIEAPYNPYNRPEIGENNSGFLLTESITLTAAGFFKGVYGLLLLLKASKRLILISNIISGCLFTIGSTSLIINLIMHLSALPLKGE